MEKKRLFMTLGAMVLTGAIAVTTTLALLNNVTETKTNVFNSSKNIDTTLTEEDYWENGWTDYWPGESKAKTPVLTNTNDSDGPVYFAMRLSYIGNDGKRLSYDKDSNSFVNYASVSYEGVDGFNTNDWRLAKTYADGSQLYYYIGGTETLNKVGKGNQTNPIFDKVTVNAGITGSLSESYKNTKVYKITIVDGKEVKTLVSNTDTKLSQDEKYYDENGNEITNVVSLPEFKIEVKGFAVQATNVSVEEAQSQLENLSDANINK